MDEPQQERHIVMTKNEHIEALTQRITKLSELLTKWSDQSREAAALIRQRAKQGKQKAQAAQRGAKLHGFLRDFPEHTHLFGKKDEA